MGIISKNAFVGGELDPALWERTDLEKFRRGMATARNWIITRTGSATTRPGRMLFAQTNLLNEPVLCYSPPGSGLILEWGHLYVRVYELGGPYSAPGILLATITQSYTAADLPFMHFETEGSYVYVFCTGFPPQQFNYALGVFTPENAIFELPPIPESGAVTAEGSPTGYLVDYAVTYTIGGQESGYISLIAGYAFPIAAGQSNVIGSAMLPGVVINGVVTIPAAITAMNVYSRPHGGGSFGYIGSTTSDQFFLSLDQIAATFVDLGITPDFTHSPPATIFSPPLSNAVLETATGNIDPGQLLLPNTGIVYQQRLLLTDSVVDLQAIYASQPGFYNNFQLDFPTDDASALKFKAGTSGYARVYRMLDSDGLVVFTEAGIYLNQGQLGPSNIALDKKGRWIINESIPPLAVPGGVLFVDRMTNGVRNLLWSLALNAFTADEVSIYSNHLFKTRQISTWNFQEGLLPLLWVVFNDGTMASFTFEFEQQMQAWTRHDGALPVRSSAGTINPDQSYFVVGKTDALGNVTRYIEMTVPRYVPPAVIALDQNYQMNPSCAMMDGIVSYNGQMQLKGTDVFTVTPAERDVNGNPDWTQQPLNLYCGSSGLFQPISGPLAAGTILRFFDSDGTNYDLSVVQVLTANWCLVNYQTNTQSVDFNDGGIDPAPSQFAFPQNLATITQLYLTTNVITGLQHLINEYPGVIVDGAVVCSPNNDVDNYPQIQVAVNGTLTLPAGVYGAMVHVGRPFIADLQTLNIDTVEQQPTLIESINVGKIYIKVLNSRGLYVSNDFPVDDNGVPTNGVKHMVDLDDYIVDYKNNPSIIGNRGPQPQTKRVELTLPGDWQSQGMVCIRQVDPLHAEILSIIPDVEVERRSDR